MTIQVACNECGKQYSVPDDKAGKRLKCKQCGTPVEIPLEDEFGLDDEFAAPQRPVRSSRSAGQRSTKRKGGGKKKSRSKSSNGPPTAALLTVGGGVVFLLLLAIGGYFLFRGSGEPTAADSQQPAEADALASTNPNGAAGTTASSSSTVIADPLAAEQPAIETEIPVSEDRIQAEELARNPPRINGPVTPMSIKQNTKERQVEGTIKLIAIAPADRTDPAMAQISLAGTDNRVVRILFFPTTPNILNLRYGQRIIAQGDVEPLWGENIDGDVIQILRARLVRADAYSRPSAPAPWCKAVSCSELIELFQQDDGKTLREFDAFRNRVPIAVSGIVKSVERLMDGMEAHTVTLTDSDGANPIECVVPVEFQAQRMTVGKEITLIGFYLFGSKSSGPDDPTSVTLQGCVPF